MFAQILLDPASTIEEVSIRVFYESLLIFFPNNSFAAKVNSTACHPMEERGGVSRAH